jgi:hypothetical protein
MDVEDKERDDEIKDVVEHGIPGRLSKNAPLRCPPVAQGARIFDFGFPILDLTAVGPAFHR